MNNTIVSKQGGAEATIAEGAAATPVNVSTTDNMKVSEIVKPSYYLCGGGSHINCEGWDDVNGCWQDQTDAFRCTTYLELDAESRIMEDD